MNSNEAEQREISGDLGEAFKITILNTRNPKLASFSETSRMALFRYAFLETIETPYIILVRKSS